MEHGYNSNDPIKNLDKFLSDEGLEMTSKDREEITSIVSGSDAEATLLHGKTLINGTNNHLEWITGTPLKDMRFLLLALLLANLFVFYHLQVHEDELLVSTSLYDYYERQANHDNSSENVTEVPPDLNTLNTTNTGSGHLLPPEKGNALPTLIDSTTIDNRLGSEDFGNYFKYERDSIALLRTKQIDKIKITSSENESIVAAILQAATPLSGIKNEEPYKLVTFIISDISKPQKTDLLVEKGTILHLATHGTLINSSGTVLPLEELSVCTPASQKPFIEPLLSNYHVGALLYRVGEQSEWTPCSNETTKVIAEKSGFLEFLVNLKTPDIKKVSIVYSVEVMAHYLGKSEISRQ